MIPIPFGYCHCRCGQMTPIINKTHSSLGRTKGQPAKFIRGHQGFRRPLVEEAAPFKIDGVYCRLIPLTRGLYVIVDLSEYERLMQYSWQAHKAIKSGTFYATRRTAVNGIYRELPMHSEILGLPLGDPRICDHANGCSLDNRRNNLRAATIAENNWNSKKRRDNSSGFKGVSWESRAGRYKVQLQHNRQKIFLGYCDDPVVGHAMYAAAAKAYHGQFARLA